MRLGKLYKEAEQFRELQQGLSELIELSQVPVKEKIKGAGIAQGHYYRQMAAKNFNAKQLLGAFKTIIEKSNYEIIRNKRLKHEDQ